MHLSLAADTVFYRLEKRCDLAPKCRSRPPTADTFVGLSAVALAGRLMRLGRRFGAEDRQSSCRGITAHRFSRRVIDHRLRFLCCCRLGSACSCSGQVVRSPAGTRGLHPPGSGQLSALSRSSRRSHSCLAASGQTTGIWHSKRISKVDFFLGSNTSVLLPTPTFVRFLNRRD